MFIDIVGHNGKIIHSVSGGSIMFKKFVLASVNFFHSDRTKKIRFVLVIAWLTFTTLAMVTGTKNVYMLTCLLTTLILFIVGAIASVFIKVFAMRLLKNCFTFNEAGIVQVFDSRQFIWQKDFETMKPNLASYEENHATLSLTCTDEEWDDVFTISIFISFGGTPEKMLGVIRRFGNNRIIDEMNWRISEVGVCNICKANAISIVQDILGESVHVLQIKKEQSLYCIIDTIYL